MEITKVKSSANNTLQYVKIDTKSNYNFLRDTSLIVFTVKIALAMAFVYKICATHTAYSMHTLRPL